MNSACQDKESASTVDAFLKAEDYDAHANEQFSLFKGKCHFDSSRTPFITNHEILHV